MATIAAFNGMIGEFLSQIRQTGVKLKLKDPGTLKQVQEILRQCQESDDPKKQRLVLDKFAKYTIPHRALIQERDVAFFEYAKESPLLSKIGFHLFWDKLPEQSQQGIWQFLNQLLTMAIAIKAIPEGMLGQIESMAQSLVTQQMAGNEQAMPNPADLAQMLGSMSSLGAGPPNIMPGGGAAGLPAGLGAGGLPAGLGALLGSLGPPGSLGGPPVAGALPPPPSPSE